MRQKAYVAFLVAAAVLLSACGHHSGPRPGQQTLGMVTDVGGLGDKSFNDSAYSGLLRAQTQLGSYIDVLQSTSAADYQPNLSTLSEQKYDMIYAIGFLMSKDLDQVAKDHPKQHYAIIDAVVNDPNVISVTFQEQDGSFLAGALAAMVTKTHHVAFMGGQDIPLLRKFEAGFTAGVHEIAPADKVDVKYVNSFQDVAAGKEVANVEYQSGADIIYAAAGKAGLGAIDAAKARPNAYIIGVDSDQDGLAPGKILTSMVKHVDIAVYDIAQDAKEGKLPHGHLTLGLADHAITLTDFKYTRNLIGPDIINKINALQQMITNHDIIVPATRGALATFKPVKM
jgi:basic membrane protein A